MKTRNLQEAEMMCKMLNESPKTEWFCPFRNNYCFGSKCVAFEPATVERSIFILGNLNKVFKVDEDLPECNISCFWG